MALKLKRNRSLLLFAAWLSIFFLNMFFFTISMAQDGALDGRESYILDDARDKKYVRLAVEVWLKYLNERNVPLSISQVPGAVGNIESKEPLRFEDVDEFLRINPECCTFSYRGIDGYLPPLLWRLTKGYQGTVMVRTSRYQLDDGSVVEFPPIRRSYAIIRDDGVVRMPY